MKLSFMLEALRKRWLLILVVAVVVAGGVAVLGSLWPKTYTSSAQILLGVKATANPTGIDAQSANLYLKERVATYAQMVKADEVTEPVASAAGISPDELRRYISVAIIPETVVLEISVSGRTPEQAVALTNAVSQRFRSQVSSLNVKTGGPELVAAQFSSPQPAEDPDQLHGALLYLVSTLVGLLAGVLVALVVAAIESVRQSPRKDNREDEETASASDDAPSSGDERPIASEGNPAAGHELRSAGHDAPSATAVGAPSSVRAETQSSASAEPSWSGGSGSPSSASDQSPWPARDGLPSSASAVDGPTASASDESDSSASDSARPPRWVRMPSSSSAQVGRSVMPQLFGQVHGQGPQASPVRFSFQSVQDNAKELP